MRKCLVTIGFVCTLLPALAQNWHEADSLRKALHAAASKEKLSTVLKLAEYSLDNAYTNKNYVDSIDLYIKEAKQLNTKYHLEKEQNYIEMLFAVVYSFRNLDNDAKLVFLPLIAEAKKRGYKSNEIFAWNNLPFFMKQDEKSYPFIINGFERALLLARQLNNVTEIVNTSGSIARYRIMEGQVDQAGNELSQIIDAYQKSIKPGDFINIYDALTVAYQRNGSIDKALYFALKTIKAMEMSGDSLHADTYYNRVGTIYHGQKNYASGLEWSKKALAHVIILKNYDHIFYLSEFVVSDLLRMGKAREALRFILDKKAKYKPANLLEKGILAASLGNIYEELKEYQLAEKSFLQMLDYDSRDKTPDLILHKAVDFENIAIFYQRIKRYALAKKYFEKALMDYEPSATAAHLRSIYFNVFQVDTALGNYKSAISYLRRNNRISDSMFSASKNKQIEELQIKYKTNEREKDLKLSKEKEKLAENNLQQSRNTRNWIIAGSGLLLIIAGLLYRQSRLRKRTNQTITRQNELITHKNELLQHLVTEKEWLLKEVHHRVKNNLHSVISLLEAQAAYLENDALKAIENSQHRIYTMSLIHQKLYQADDIKTIDMAIYVPELVQYLRDSFDVSMLHFLLDIEPIHLNAAQAIPLGLIINEALTNCIKYAFPEGQRGEITVSLVNHGTNYRLEIADNGIGMHKKAATNVKSSLGLELIRGLAKEIGGEIIFENNNGFKISVIFERDMLHNIDHSPADYLATAQVGGNYQ